MKGTVKNVVASGTFKDLYVFEVDIENEAGEVDTYKKYAKKDNAFVTVGDVITFDTNDKMSLKNVNKVSGSQGQQMANGKPQEPVINQQKQHSIQRQVCLKCAVEFFANPNINQKSALLPEHVLYVAEMFEVWVETGVIPAEEPEPAPVHPGELVNDHQEEPPPF